MHAVGPGQGVPAGPFTAHYPTGGTYPPSGPSYAIHGGYQHQSGPASGGAVTNTGGGAPPSAGLYYGHWVPGTSGSQPAASDWHARATSGYAPASVATDTPRPASFYPAPQGQRPPMPMGFAHGAGWHGPWSGYATRPGPGVCAAPHVAQALAPDFAQGPLQAQVAEGSAPLTGHQQAAPFVGSGWSLTASAQGTQAMPGSQAPSQAYASSTIGVAGSHPDADATALGGPGTGRGRVSKSGGEPGPRYVPACMLEHGCLSHQ